VTAGSIASSNLSAGSYTTSSTPTLNIGAVTGPVYLSLHGGSVTVGAIAMDGANAGLLSIGASGSLTLGGAITSADGTGVSISAGNTGSLFFSRIDTGNAGSVSIVNTGSIEQAQAAASGGGIRAGTVRLSAGGSLFGPSIDNARMTLRNTTDLTLGIGTNSRIALVGGAGSAPGPELVNLNITRSLNAGAFVLDGLSPAQTLALVDTDAATRITLDSSGSAAALDFRYANLGSAGAIEVLSIRTKGGSVLLEAPNGDVRATAINAAGSESGRRVNIDAGGNVDVAGLIDGGDSPVTINAAQQVRRIAADGEVRSNATVRVLSIGGDAIGASPANQRFRVTAPSVNLDGGDIYADLAGTTELNLRAANTVSVASDTALRSLRLSIDATGTGADP
jgi:hypothetical protein